MQMMHAAASNNLQNCSSLQLIIGLCTKIQLVKTETYFYPNNIYANVFVT
ncbi:hypothetical protein JN11_04564 [Mucilaginibacter frigoritolerans]|jgi:hypothetical protein|uniref:Uncharacterized protein n=1 Tax=Mucilaginibacter frigoritolerans TaxID=652788 RepID=A0A562TN05_9SPHI|nr:hypothetical protein JN11_04564 [Mucilaginibacter frigoritolerans]